MSIIMMEMIEEIYPKRANPPSYYLMVYRDDGNTPDKMGPGPVEVLDLVAARLISAESKKRK